MSIFTEELRECKKIVAKDLVGKDFKSVLEVGTQWGESLKAIGNLFKDKKLVGVDTDKVVIFSNKFNLDLKMGNVLGLKFPDNSFDVVFTNALFCNLSPDAINQGLDEIVRVANKYVYLVELELPKKGYCNGGRTGANWKELLEKKGLKVESRKITKEEWPVEPWLTYGHLYKAIWKQKSSSQSHLLEKHPVLILQETDSTVKNGMDTD